MVATILRLPAEPARIGNARRSLRASASVFMFGFVVVGSLGASGWLFLFIQSPAFQINKPCGMYADKSGTYGSISYFFVTSALGNMRKNGSPFS